VLDASASYDPASDKAAIFIVNRSLTDSVVTDIAWQDGRTVTLDKAWQLAGADPKALNTWENRHALTAQPIAAPRVENGKATIQLPPLSFTVLTAHAQ
jgi:alpha-N-arabinofuranosidase